MRVDAKRGDPVKPRQRWHLARNESELVYAEFQHALICLAEAFYRYIGNSLALVAGEPSLNGYDSVILHTIETQNRPKSITDIQHFTNRTDIANIQYSVRKLIRAGLIRKAPRNGKRGTSYTTTAHGRRVIARHLAERRALLAQALRDPGALLNDVRKATRVMSTLTGLYDYGSRRTTTQS